jgi:hypothetical protein
MVSCPYAQLISHHATKTYGKVEVYLHNSWFRHLQNGELYAQVDLPLRKELPVSIG